MPLDDEDYSRAVCDGKGCGQALVQAKVVSALPSGRVLTLCFHHANRYRDGIQDLGGIIIDLRATG